MPFERPTLERCSQVSCVALAPSVMLASVQLLARTQGKNPQETPDFLSRDTDRWALHLLLRGRPERRADASLAARAALFVADVRASLRQAVRSLSPCRARFPRLRTQRLAGPKKFAYTFDHTAEIINHFTEVLGLSGTRFTCTITAALWA